MDRASSKTKGKQKRRKDIAERKDNENGNLFDKKNRETLEAQVRRNESSLSCCGINWRKKRGFNCSEPTF